jgi:hypothetical protein
MKESSTAKSPRRRKDSISFIFSRHQIIMFLIISLFFLGNTLVLFANERKSVISERNFQINYAAEKAESRMKGYENNLLDTLTTVLNNYNGLWSNENGKKSFDKYKLNQLLINKRRAGGAPLYYFAKQKGDFIVFQGGDSEAIESRLPVKDYIEENVEDIVTGTNEREWKFREIDGQVYCFYCYYVSADIYVGVVQKPEVLFEELYNLAGNYNGAIEIKRNGEILYSYKSGKITKGSFGVTDFKDRALGYGMSTDATFKIQAATYFRINIITIAILGLILCILLVLFSNRVLKEKIIDPVKSLSDAVGSIDEVNETTSVSADTDVYEIRHLEKGINSLLSDVIYNRMEAYLAELRKKEQELSSLRSQIRPHFFLNAITTVNAMTYQDRNEDIRNYLMRLSDFMRYIIDDSSEMVLLSEELNNVSNYCKMQEIRFPGRAFLFAESTDIAKQIRVPRCLLLTVAENSYKYAMGASDVLQIFLDCREVEEENFEGVLISLEDNGPGFSREQLNYYNDESLADGSKKGHVGLLNIKETLKLTYKKEGLLKLDNAVPQGARVEIRIPYPSEE